MITLPTTLPQVKACEGSLRAGGTDLSELRHRGIATGPVVDLRDLPGLDAVTATPDGGLQLGALARLARIAADPAIAAGWAGLSEAAGGLATPQIRARATLGGSLAQQVRCWYYRSPEFQCLKKGGATCFARSGDAVYHAAVDLGPCIAPHPSTMAAAVWAYDGRIQVDGAEFRDVPTALGDGKDPRSTHAFGPGELVTAVVLPAPVVGEQGAYWRAIHRARAEWPLVECVVRVRLDDAGAIAALVVVLGGIANRPLRFDEACHACVGVAPDDPRLDDIFGAMVIPSASLPQTAYKARLVPTTIRETLDRALAGPKVAAAAAGGVR
ncbi:MAG: FAD binding domain-containing protein [Myxococcota bacterium]